MSSIGAELDEPEADLKKKFKTAWANNPDKRQDLLIAKELMNDGDKLKFCEENSGMYSEDAYEEYKRMEDFRRAFGMRGGDEMFYNVFGFSDPNGGKPMQHAHKHYHVHRRQPKGEGKLPDIDHTIYVSADELKQGVEDKLISISHKKFEYDTTRVIQEDCQIEKEIHRTPMGVVIMKHLNCHHRYPRKEVNATTELKVTIPPNSKGETKIRIESAIPDEYGDFVITLKKKGFFKNLFDF
ncbi:MAG: hypothetical protein MHMPM18_003148 [Marteilia pararefringens]